MHALSNPPRFANDIAGTTRYTAAEGISSYAHLYVSRAEGQPHGQLTRAKVGAFAESW